MIALLFAFALHAPQSPAAPALPRVYVYTSESGDSDDVRDRGASVKDLRAALKDKKKDLVVVDAESDADLLVEVLDRAVTIPRVVFGMAPRMGQQPDPAGPTHEVHLHVAMRHPNETALDISSKNGPLESTGGWKSAADDVAKQIDKWIVDHRR
jgi:hypothetical protein